MTEERRGKLAEEVVRLSSRIDGWRTDEADRWAAQRTEDAGRWAHHDALVTSLSKQVADLQARLSKQNSAIVKITNNLAERKGARLENRIAALEERPSGAVATRLDALEKSAAAKDEAVTGLATDVEGLKGWRNKVYGGIALVVLLGTILGVANNVIKLFSP